MDGSLDQLSLDVSSMGAARVQLRILATSDLHMQVYPHDYGTDRPDPSRGLAALTSAISEARAEAPNTLLFDNGDVIHGNPMGDLAAREAARSGPGTRRAHPAIAAMNLLGYDAATVGNHEFNYGLDVLMETYAQCTFPIVLANLRRTGRNGAPIFSPWHILERDVLDQDGIARRLRIGVVGFAPSDIPIWDRHRLKGSVESEPILEAALRTVPELRAAGADVVVALCHAGVGNTATTDEGLGAARALANVPGIDAVVGGHTHERYAGAVSPDGDATSEVPIVASGSHGTHLGVIDLDLSQDCAGDWHRDASRSVLVPATGTSGPPRCKRALARCLNAVVEDHRRTLAHIRRRLAWTDTPITSYFSLAGDWGAQGTVGWAVRAWLSENMPAPPEDAPLLISTAPYPAGGFDDPADYLNIPAGEVLMRHLTMLYPFPNLLQVRRMRGAHVRAWLERSAAAYLPVTPGARAPALRLTDVAPYDFDALDGVTWSVDLSRPRAVDCAGHPVPGAAGRITELRYRGRRVRDDDLFHIAVNTYRSAGSGGVPADWPDEPFFEPDRSVFAMISEIMERRGTIPPQRSAPWRFAPIEGASAIFRTSPSARAHGAVARTLGLEDTGRTDADGFALYRLQF
ncbi:metallophosphoesterase [Roseivivax halodurans]|nr:5'-nucleotidase C-terminal domain-containing protein [Roseivivax halodurans]